MGDPHVVLDLGHILFCCSLFGEGPGKLAREAGLGLSTIVDFEKMRREVSNQAIEAMQKALERAGIEFIDENGGGAGVRLRKHRRSRRSTSGH